MGSSWSYTESELEAVEEGSREVSLRRMNSSFVDLKGVVMKTQTGVEEMEKRTAGKNIISEEWLNQAPDFQELGKLVEMANVLRKVAVSIVLIMMPPQGDVVTVCYNCQCPCLLLECGRNVP